MELGSHDVSLFTRGVKCRIFMHIHLWNDGGSISLIKYSCIFIEMNALNFKMKVLRSAKLSWSIK